MRTIKGIVDFTAGVALGAVAGVGVAYLTTSRSGDELRTDSQELIDSAKLAGEQARVERESQLRSKFRERVGRDTALTDLPGI